MQLFLDELKFEKLAQTDIGDPEKWGEKILKILLDKHPYLGKYPMQIVWHNKKEDVGTANGYIQVKASDKELKIPIFIKGNKLFDLDLFVCDRRFYPLNQVRVESCLFSPKNIEGTIPQGQQPISLEEDPLMASRFPPNRWGIGIKYSSLLRALKPTMRSEHLMEIGHQLSRDATLNKLAFNNKAVVEALKIMAESEKMEKKASRHEVRPPAPDVIQIISLDNNKYLVKTANHKAFRIESRVMDRKEAIMKFGEAPIRSADVNKAIVTTSSPAGEIVDKREKIEWPGVYRVTSKNGDVLTGMVITDVYDFTPSRLNVKLFISGDSYSFQDDMVGERCGDIALESKGLCKGTGVFIWHNENPGLRDKLPSDVHATIPFTIDRIEQEDGTLVAYGTDLAGTVLRVIPSAVKGIIRTNDIVMVPENCTFYPVSKLEPIVGSMEIEKEGSRVPVTISYRDNTFWFSGPSITKIASHYVKNLAYHDAMFICCSLGMSPEFAKEKLAQAIKHGNTTVKVAHALKSYDDFAKEVLDKVAVYKKAIETRVQGLRCNLLKEAVAISDEDTIDTILGLNFLTPENVKKFMEYLPQLEAVQEKLCLLLVGTRLGVRKIPETALKNTIAAMEKVIEGLRQLNHSNLEV